MLGFVCYVSQIWHNRIMWFCRLFNLYYLNLLVFVYVENFSLGPFNNYVTHKFPILQGFQFQDFSQQLYLLCNRIRCHPKTFIPFLASASCCHMATIRSRLTFSAKIFLHIQCVIAFNIVVNMLT